MVEVPFFAGQEVGAPYFFDREQYRIELKTKLAAEAPLNFALTGPRRIGKTSLMKKVAEELDGEVIAIVIKCEKIMPKTKLEFANLLAREVQRSLVKLDPIEKVKEFLSKLKQKISVKVGTKLIEDSEMFIKVKFEENMKINVAYDFAFELINHIQEDYKKKVVIFLDEFQELFSFGSDYLWALRGYIADSKASFVVSSSYHRFEEQLIDKKQPFFNFFSLEKIGPIPKKECEEYVLKRLKGVNIDINKKALDNLLHVAEGKPYYLQYIGSKLYDVCKRRGANEISWQIYRIAFDEIMETPPAQLISVFSKVKGKTKQVFVAFCLFNPKKSSDLAQHLDESPSAITQLLNQLYTSHGLLYPKEGFFVVADQILKEWIKKQFKSRTVTQFYSPTLSIDSDGETQEKINKEFKFSK